jgi:release factor glutamine methyltransferase
MGREPAHGGWRRALWRRWLWWRFRLFQRHRHDRLVLERVAGYPILVLPGVFNPALFGTSELLARTLAGGLVPAGASVLDMGTGSGIGAVAAARWAGRVVAVDSNPAAVRCARINALLNGVEERVTVRQGDLFAAVAGERFDLVLFNPPYFRGEPRDSLEAAFRSPDVVERFAAGLAAHLTPGGQALVVLSTDGDLAGFQRAFADHGFQVTGVAERRLPTETLIVYGVRHRSRLADGV